jgi:hypothetical protein
MDCVIQADTYESLDEITDDSTEWATNEPDQQQQPWDWTDDLSSPMTFREASVEHQVNNRISLEILELTNTPSFWAKTKPWVDGISIIVATRVDLVSLSSRQKEMLGLVQPYIVTELKFPMNSYWTTLPSIEYVSQCGEKDGKPDVGNHIPFFVSWSARHRLRNTWSKEYLNTYKKPSFEPHDISQIIDATQVSFAQAVQSLIEHKYSCFDAIIALTNHSTSSEVSSFKSSSNVYIHLCLALLEYLQNAHHYCMVCDCKLENAGIKPSVCDKDLCCHVYDTLGLGFNINSEIIRDAPVLDLYITLFVAASTRKKLQFVKLNIEDDESFDEDAICTHLCSSCPSITSLKELALQGIDVRKVLNDISPKLYPILRWLITSSRSYLKSIEPENQIHDMDTPYQFILLTDTPEREKVFQELKSKEQKWFYAFHGSDTSNWFSILRTGLKNLSNTKYMTTGAAYGPGIYLGETSKMSESYATIANGWPYSMFGEHMRCMALCEVIGTPEDKSGSGIYVIPEDIRVSTRYFFVYPNQQSIPSTSAKQIFNK